MSACRLLWVLLLRHTHSSHCRGFIAGAAWLRATAMTLYYLMGVTLLAFPLVVSACVRLVMCVPALDNAGEWRHVLQSLPDVVCYTGLHSVAGPLAWITLAVFGVGGAVAVALALKSLASSSGSSRGSRLVKSPPPRQQLLGMDNPMLASNLKVLRTKAPTSTPTTTITILTTTGSGGDESKSISEPQSSPQAGSDITDSRSPTGVVPAATTASGTAASADVRSAWSDGGATKSGAAKLRQSTSWTASRSRTRSALWRSVLLHQLDGVLLPARAHVTYSVVGLLGALAALCRASASSALPVQAIKLTLSLACLSALTVAGVLSRQSFTPIARRVLLPLFLCCQCGGAALAVCAFVTALATGPSAVPPVTAAAVFAVTACVVCGVGAVSIVAWVAILQARPPSRRRIGGGDAGSSPQRGGAGDGRDEEAGADPTSADVKAMGVVVMDNAMLGWPGTSFSDRHGDGRVVSDDGVELPRLSRNRRRNGEGDGDVGVAFGGDGDGGSTRRVQIQRMQIRGQRAVGGGSAGAVLALELSGNGVADSAVRVTRAVVTPPQPASERGECKSLDGGGVVLSSSAQGVGAGTGGGAGESEGVDRVGGVVGDGTVVVSASGQVHARAALPGGEGAVTVGDAASGRQAQALSQLLQYRDVGAAQGRRRHARLK